MDNKLIEQSKQSLITIINGNVQDETLHDALFDLIRCAEVDLSNNSVNYKAVSFETNHYSFYIGYYPFTKELHVELNRFDVTQVIDADQHGNVDSNTIHDRVKAELFNIQARMGTKDRTFVKHTKDGASLLVNAGSEYPIVNIDANGCITNHEYPSDQKQSVIDSAKSAIYKDFVVMSKEAITEYNKEQNIKY